MIYKWDTVCVGHTTRRLLLRAALRNMERVGSDSCVSEIPSTAHRSRRRRRRSIIHGSRPSHYTTAPTAELYHHHHPPLPKKSPGDERLFGGSSHPRTHASHARVAPPAERSTGWMCPPAGRNITRSTHDTVVMLFFPVRQRQPPGSAESDDDHDHDDEDDRCMYV
jgi:hypothetical protein